MPMSPDMAEAIKSSIAMKSVKPIVTYLNSSISPQPHMFRPKPVSWQLFIRQDAHRRDVKETHSPQALHLARLLVGCAIESYFCLNNDERDSLFSQLNDFYRTGTIHQAKPKKIDLNNKDTWPQQLLSVSDTGYGLVWRHPKYCIECGNIIAKRCYCHDRGDEDTMVFQSCWKCQKDKIDHFLTGGIGERYPKDICMGLYDEHMESFIDWVNDELPHSTEAINHDEAMKEWEERFGQFYEATPDGVGEDQSYSAVLKTLDADTLPKFWDAVNDFWEGSDYDEPEDACSCLNF